MFDRLLDRFRRLRLGPTHPEAPWWFTCNICGTENRRLRRDFGRETPSCDNCRSTVRMRGIVYALSMGLFGKGMAIGDFPVRKDLRLIGMTDWKPYADRLAEKFDYTNTFYDHEPRLDITDPPAAMHATLDAIVSTDVFEHVAPPIDRAFEQAAALLKPGGHLVFSVPYNLEGETVEHFPNLHDFTIDRSGERPRLINRTRDGREETFDDLVFHGGEGATLEMRVFSLPSLKRQLTEAGFTDIRVWDQDEPKWGVIWPERWSLPISARKGEQGRGSRE